MLTLTLWLEQTLWLACSLAWQNAFIKSLEAPGQYKPMMLCACFQSTWSTRRSTCSSGSGWLLWRRWPQYPSWSILHRYSYQLLYLHGSRRKQGRRTASKYKQLCLTSFYNKPFPDQHLCSSFSVSVLKWTIFNWGSL